MNNLYNSLLNEDIQKEELSDYIQKIMSQHRISKKFLRDKLKDNSKVLDNILYRKSKTINMDSYLLLKKYLPGLDNRYLERNNWIHKVEQSVSDHNKSGVFHKEKQVLHKHVNDHNIVEEHLKHVKIDINKIKGEIHRRIQESQNIFKSDKISMEKKTHTLTQIMVDIFREIDWKDVPEAIIASTIIVILNFTALVFINTIIGPPAGIIITTLIVAPLIEEMGKKIFIHKGASGTFLIVFSSVDFIANMVRFAGFPIHGVLMGRAVTLLAHYATTVIQAHSIYKDDPKKAGWSGYMAAVIVHAMVNALGLMFRR